MEQRTREQEPLPPPGRRTGHGADSLVQFIREALLGRPKAPRQPNFLDTPGPTSPADLDDSRNS